MTHTAYRLGNEESLKMDYVVLCIAARNFNHQSCAEKLRKMSEIFRKHNPVNFGDVKQGSIWREGLDFDRIVSELKDTSVIHGVFTRLEDVKGAVKDLKAADLGISVVVTGLFKDVFCLAEEAGLKPHCVGISLGIFGRTEKLAPLELREVTSMCGHNMIGPHTVKDVIADVRKGKIKVEAAAKEMAESCICGLFNPIRAALLIQNLAEVQNAAIK